MTLGIRARAAWGWIGSGYKNCCSWSSCCCGSCGCCRKSWASAGFVRVSWRRRPCGFVAGDWAGTGAEAGTVGVVGTEMATGAVINGWSDFPDQFYVMISVMDMKSHLATKLNWTSLSSFWEIEGLKGLVEGWCRFHEAHMGLHLVQAQGVPCRCK